MPYFYRKYARLQILADLHREVSCTLSYEECKGVISEYPADGARKVTFIVKQHEGKRNMSASILLSMAGGLGLFLFGMRVMSDSIEKVAGAKLRRILEIFTTNRFTGMVVGIVFTGIYPVVIGLYGHGCQLCKRRTYEPVSGCRCYFWR